MKDNKGIKINNELKNKGITFPDDMSFGDVLQSWLYLSRFMFDLIEDKSTIYCLIPQDEKVKSRSAAEFKVFLKYWYEYAEKTIHNDVEITIKELSKNEKQDCKINKCR